ncbi:MAG: 50S ribosomal protein L18 [Candidatus Micrarchaeaceae archaeon]
MAKQTRKLAFRRRREGKTNYAKRLALVKSGMYRVVVRSTDRRIIGQVIAYEPNGDKIIASTESNELKKLGWPSRPNRPTAYLTGMLLAKKFKQNEECVLDIGLRTNTKGSIPFVFAKGFADAGKKLRGNFEIEQKVYDGSAIAAYAASDKKSKNQFSAYEKSGVKVEQLPELFKSIYEKIKNM